MLIIATIIYSGDKTVLMKIYQECSVTRCLHAVIEFNINICDRFMLKYIQKFCPDIIFFLVCVIFLYVLIIFKVKKHDTPFQD